MRTPGSEISRVGRGWVWALLAIAAAVVIVAAMLRWRETARLREDVAAERARGVRETDPGQGAQSAERPVAVDAAELARMNADREALPRLRAEVGALKKSVEESRLIPGKPKADATQPVDIEKDLVPSDAWRNAGYATPVAAVETALWAAAGGDTAVLMQSIVMDEGARRKAAALWEGLPAETQARYPKPEELVAFMAAKDVPLEGARIMTSKEPKGETQKATVQLRNAAGSVRQVHIELRKTGDGWRLVMPESAVDRYATQLKGRGR